MVRLEPWRAALAAIEGGGRAVIVTVVGHSAHSPGTRGATLAVFSDRVLGTIGGGIMEARAISRARELLAQTPTAPTRERLEHRERSGQPSGLFCAGDQTNVWLSLQSTDAAAIAAGLDRGELYVCANGLSAHPPEVSTWWERIGLCLADRVLVIGAGHCGQALARQMRSLAWDVALLDPRPTVSTVITGEVITPVASYDRVGEHVDPRTAAVVMTHSFETDVQALTSLLTARDRAPFIGLMGSTAKKQRVAERLGEVALSLEGVHCPVGLEMRSDTPEEIAVSVSAQLLRWAR